MDARELACHVIYAVMDKGAFSGDELRRAFDSEAGMDARDRHFASRLVRGTLENVLLLDHVLGRFTKEPIKKCKPMIRELLRMGAYQVLFMDSVSDAAAVDESVKLAAKLGFKAQRGFVNAVLRNLCRDKTLPEGPVELLCSVPDYVYGLIRKQYGEEAAKEIVLSFQNPEKLCVTFLHSKADEATIISSLEKEGITAKKALLTQSSWYLEGYSRIDKTEAFEKGWLQVQGLGSALAGQLINPKPGSTVLDLCAAPGGKTIHMADLMLDHGLIIAADNAPERLIKIDENIARCGFTCIKTVSNDAAVFNSEWEGSMDYVLADLPCSGLGTVGHRPEIRYRVNPSFLKETVSLQRKILSNAWTYLKPGGIMVFSTCTINKTENEDNIKWLLKTAPLEMLPGDSFPEGMGEQGFLQLIPGKDPCGFFVSRCRRTR